jgi:NAD(P)H dehydrogenase (quinone)
MSRVSGKQIVLHNETLDEAYEARSHYGAPRWEIEGWVTSYTSIAAGELAAVSDAVQRLAGHPHITLAEHIGANPGSLAHVTPRQSCLIPWRLPRRERPNQPGAPVGPRT